MYDSEYNSDFNDAYEAAKEAVFDSATPVHTDPFLWSVLFNDKCDLRLRIDEYHTLSQNFMVLTHPIYDSLAECVALRKEQSDGPDTRNC